MTRRDAAVLIVGVALGAAGFSLWLRFPWARRIDWDRHRSDGVPLPAAQVEAWNDNALEALGGDLSNLRRVTTRPVQVEYLVDSLKCVGGPTNGMAPSPHSTYAIHVYASPESESPLLNGDAEYPEGAVILKQKLTSAGDTELYTGMLRRESGYNPDCGDWEFFVLSGYRQLLARGRIESCMECHREFADRGYVSRLYLTGK